MKLHKNIYIFQKYLYVYKLSGKNDGGYNTKDNDDDNNINNDSN